MSVCQCLVRLYARAETAGAIIIGRHQTPDDEQTSSLRIEDFGEIPKLSGVSHKFENIQHHPACAPQLASSKHQRPCTPEHTPARQHASSQHVVRPTHSSAYHHGGQPCMSWSSLLLCQVFPPIQPTLGATRLSFTTTPAIVAPSTPSVISSGTVVANIRAVPWCFGDHCYCDYSIHNSPYQILHSILPRGFTKS